MGFGGLALGAMLYADGVARAGPPGHAARPDGRPQLPPRARSVIWIFLSGGYSHLETFDPKPALERHAGRTYAQTPYPNPQRSPLFLQRSRSVVGVDRDLFSRIYPMQVGFRRHGQSGIALTDWWPHLAGCVDDIAFVRSMYTTDNDHGAEFQMHHGRHVLDERQPTVGSWVHYGLGTLNENLPKFVFLGRYTDTRVRQNFDADYLGPQHGGVELSLEPGRALPFAAPGRGVLPREQQNEIEFIGELDRLAAAEHPDDEQLQARLRSYELAYRMQAAVPEALDLGRETAETHRLYGIDNPATAAYGRRLLAARRLAERGVRFTLVYLSDYGEWDSHTNLRANHARSCARVDKPVAGLLRDLKRSGLGRDVLVVFCTEFGRTPAVEDRRGFNATGRDHHPHGFTVWLAGAGIRGGIAHGATDELGFHAVEHAHYVTDLHATVLDRLGLDGHRLAIPGRQRLEIDHGTPIREILV
jgi:hypothetical protein